VLYWQVPQCQFFNWQKRTKEGKIMFSKNLARNFGAPKSVGIVVEQKERTENNGG